MQTYNGVYFYNFEYVGPVEISTPLEISIIILLKNRQNQHILSNIFPPKKLQIWLILFENQNSKRPNGHHTPPKHPRIVQNALHKVLTKVSCSHHLKISGHHVQIVRVKKAKLPSQSHVQSPKLGVRPKITIFKLNLGSLADSFKIVPLHAKKMCLEAWKVKKHI